MNLILLFLIFSTTSTTFSALSRNEALKNITLESAQRTKSLLVGMIADPEERLARAEEHRPEYQAEFPFYLTIKALTATERCERALAYVTEGGARVANCALAPFDAKNHSLGVELVFQDLSRQLRKMPGLTQALLASEKALFKARFPREQPNILSLLVKVKYRLAEEFIDYLRRKKEEGPDAPLRYQNVAEWIHVSPVLRLNSNSPLEFTLDFEFSGLKDRNPRSPLNSLHKALDDYCTTALIEIFTELEAYYLANWDQYNSKVKPKVNHLTKITRYYYPLWGCGRNNALVQKRAQVNRKWMDPSNAEHQRVVNALEETIIQYLIDLGQIEPGTRRSVFSTDPSMGDRLTEFSVFSNADIKVFAQLCAQEFFMVRDKIAFSPPHQSLTLTFQFEKLKRMLKQGLTELGKFFGPPQLSFIAPKNFLAAHNNKDLIAVCHQLLERELLQFASTTDTPGIRIIY